MEVSNVNKYEIVFFCSSPLFPELNCERTNFPISFDELLPVLVPDEWLYIIWTTLCASFLTFARGSILNASKLWNNDTNFGCFDHFLTVIVEAIRFKISSIHLRV